jgi:phospholipase C
MLISPWADRDLDVDHQTLSYDAYLKLIEDRFLGGQRLDPQTDGWWDPRPTIREEVAILGDLAKEFDFTQRPIPPLILDARPSG